jgi:hypothetical protein
MSREIFSKFCINAPSPAANILKDAIFSIFSILDRAAQHHLDILRTRIGRRFTAGTEDETAAARAFVD